MNKGRTRGHPFCRRTTGPWGAGFGLKIPLNQLPRRRDDLPKDKITVTAFPLKDRAIIAMGYLPTRGFDARYLTDGLIGPAENLRGDEAKCFMKIISEMK